MTKAISVLVAVLAFAPVAAFADIDIDSGYPTPQNQTVTVGDSITFTVRADTDGSGNDNDWKSTEWDVVVDGVAAFCDNNPQITQSTNNVSTTWNYTSVATGTKQVVVKVFNSPNCQGTERDSAQTTLTVNDVPPPPDGDGDGIPDATDNCPAVANPAQTDVDADGIGDDCDANIDTDADGVDDVTDNCPADANAGQDDADSDGIGDVCDPTPNPAPAPSPSPSSSGPTGGGGGMCSPLTGFPECQGAANYAYHHLPIPSGAVDVQKQQQLLSLYAQLIKALTAWVDALK